MPYCILLHEAFIHTSYPQYQLTFASDPSTRFTIYCLPLKFLAPVSRLFILQKLLYQYENLNFHIQSCSECGHEAIISRERFMFYFYLLMHISIFSLFVIIITIIVYFTPYHSNQLPS